MNVPDTKRTEEALRVFRLRNGTSTGPVWSYYCNGCHEWHYGGMRDKESATYASSLFLDQIESVFRWVPDPKPVSAEQMPDETFFA